MSQLGVDKWGNPESVKDFIVAVIWNYSTKKIEVLEADKFRIIADIYDLEQDPDWGDVKNYDLGLTKSGEGKQTKYGAKAKPAKPLNPEIVQAFKDKPINLEALFVGGNPFDTKNNAQNASQAVKMMNASEVDTVTKDIPF